MEGDGEPCYYVKSTLLPVNIIVTPPYLAAILKNVVWKAFFQVCIMHVQLRLCIKGVSFSYTHCVIAYMELSMGSVAFNIQECECWHSKKISLLNQCMIYLIKLHIQ